MIKAYKRSRLPSSDQVLLSEAVEALRRESGVELSVLETAGGRTGKGVPHGTVRLELTGTTMNVETKRWTAQSDAGVLADTVRSLPPPGLLVADYVSGPMARRLRDLGTQFIDTAGNAFIDQVPVYVCIEGRRPTPDRPPVGAEPRSGAFEHKGMRVVYALLVCPAVLSRPFREIARVSGVSVGTVSRVIDALASERTIELGNKRRSLADGATLERRWLDAFPTKLRAKCWRGRFTSARDLYPDSVDLSDYGASWGGEVAAAAYTNGALRPEIATVYVSEGTEADMLRTLRLRRPTTTGDEPSGSEVEVLTTFWTPALESLGARSDDGRSLVHPLLARADLIASGDGRNLETARTLRDATSS